VQTVDSNPDDVIAQIVSHNELLVFCEHQERRFMTLELLRLRLSVMQAEYGKAELPRNTHWRRLITLFSGLGKTHSERE